MNYVSTSIPVVLLIFKENLVLIDYEYLNSCITDEEIVDPWYLQVYHRSDVKTYLWKVLLVLSCHYCFSKY